MITESIFSGRLSFGELSIEAENRVVFNFELSQNKNVFLGAYVFHPETDHCPESIELYNNDLKRCFQKINDRRRKNFIKKIHNYIANESPDMWCRISHSLSTYEEERAILAEPEETNNEHNENTEQELPLDLNEAEPDESETLEEVEGDPDLRALFDKVNIAYFNNEVHADITWAKSVPDKKRTSIVLGSFLDDRNLIRISPCLKRDFVPAFFLESVVHHEMLHSIHDRKRINGRNSIHTEEFKEAEKRYEHYEKAKIWLKENLDQLLSSE